MSEMYQRLAHSSWDCKYHVVFVPKAAQGAVVHIDHGDSDQLLQSGHFVL